MKARSILLLILLAIALLTASAGALSVPHYQVETGTISGGAYQLTSSAMQADNVASGGHYRLLGPSAPKQRGSGCCCTYLPCIQRRW